jgi:hypothetical protein
MTRKTNVRNVLTIAALSVALLAQPAAAAPETVLEFVGATIDGPETVVIEINDDLQNNRSFAWVKRSEGDGWVFECRTEPDLPHSDLVSVGSRAHHGSATVDPTIPLTCHTGAAPTSFSIECGSNGVLEHHDTGKSVIIANGVRSFTVGDTDSSTADCTLEIDGVTYDSTNGRILSATHKQ